MIEKKPSQRGFGRVYQPGYRDRKTKEKKLSPTWWVEYWHRGRQFRESSQSTNRVVAVRLLHERFEEVARHGRPVSVQAEKVAFEDLVPLLVTNYQINSRKSLDRAQDAITHLREFFGLDRAIEIQPDRIEQYIAKRQCEDAMPATMKYELAVLKRMFTLAVQAQRLINRPYIPSIEVRNTRTGFFEEPEFRAVLEHLPEEVKPVAEFMYLTGWRKQEVLTLGWRQVDFNAGVVRLEPGTTKTDEGRTFPFSIFPAMKALLERQRARTDALQQATDQIIPWVFHRDGKPIRSFRKAWDNAIKEAGIPRRIPHDFRRTAVRNLERAGVPRSVAMKLTGHQTESVYRRYAIVSERDLSEGVAKLAALHTGQERGPVERRVIEGNFEPSRKAPAKQGTSGN